jgi:hypothetical protein
MITEATTTEDLIATICNARSFEGASFEEGCRVLDAIAMYDHRCGGGQLGTWRRLDSLGPLTFVPTDQQPPHAVPIVERLARTVVAWTIAQRVSDNPSFLTCPCHRRAPCLAQLFAAWVVIDRATRVTWVECAPLKEGREQHPRAVREAGEFPSSPGGTVAAYAFLRTDEPWQTVCDSLLEAYHEAKRLLNDKEENEGWIIDTNPGFLRRESWQLIVEWFCLMQPVEINLLTTV